MAQLANAERAKEEAKAANKGKRNTKKAAAPAAKTADAAAVLESMYHEGKNFHLLNCSICNVANGMCTGEGQFEAEAFNDGMDTPTGASTPAVSGAGGAGPKKRGGRGGPKAAGAGTGRSNKKKTAKERLQMVGDGGM